MQSHELRDRFLAFFKARQHTVVPSDALIPSGDPTVLFTSAGMNQFKDYFLGKRTDLSRAASCQTCLRTGDLDKVGNSPSHHSFFEMLGNFSFGDYFKREAIQWAWEFLTSTLDFAGQQTSPHRDVCLSLPGKKLWVSIYEEDDEAFTLWRELGVPAERIRRFGQAENFWPANAPKEGPNGPCGPCSEIYFDADGKIEGPKSIEVWNLVFTQFDRQPDGSLKPLPKPNIDTGMGLERLARVVMQQETGRTDVTDYETDLFVPIMNAIGNWPKASKAKTDHVKFAERAIADHLRAIAFLIADGVRPSNESRGYVLRMLIRRASRLGRVILGMDATRFQRESGGAPVFLPALVGTVSVAMAQSPYANELIKLDGLIQEVVDQEETQFVETLASGTSRLDVLLDGLQSSKTRVIPGEEAFKLYDTYGFPLEITEDIAQERGFTVEREGFVRSLKAQQERSRAASQFGGAVFIPTTLTLKDVPKSEFVGYDALQADTVVKGIWKQDGWVSSAREGDEVGVVLERSPFYGESGGQVGDQGAIDAPNGRLNVLQTTWADDLLVHHAKVHQGAISVNEPVRAKVDETRRLKIARSHTATHLLHWALRKVLGPETAQAGSLVEVERVRFDFSALGGVRDEQRMKVEQLVNSRVLAEDPVQTDLMKLEEAQRAGALALFGEKYGSQVRVVSIGDYSKELCGGTHLRHTGSVGAFQIVAESSIAAGTRRVEALVGETALARQQEETQLLHAIAQQLGRSPQDVVQGIEEMTEQIKGAERQLKHLKVEFARLQAKQCIAEAKRINGVALVTARLDGADRELLSAMADAIRESLTEGVALLVSVEQPSTVAWVMALTSNLVTRGLHAGELLKTISAITQGGGGGRPEFAQAGGKDPAKIPEALQQAERLLREALR